jgi:hypothetical protein
MKFNIILGFLFTLSIAGCYTVYQHPNVVHKDDNGRVDLIEVSYKNNCASCHTESELEKYNYYVKKDIYITEENDTNETVKYNDVAYYYNMPWWYEVAFSDIYNPVKYDTGINGEIFNGESGRIGGGGLPPIYIPTPTQGGGGTTTTTPTKTRDNSDRDKKSTESKDDQQKSSNTRNNDGGRNNGNGRR